jgi:hypothetical protein
VFLPTEDQPVQTLFLDRAPKRSSAGVTLRNAGRAKHDLHAGGGERLPKGIAVFGIAVNDQVSFAKGETVPCVHCLLVSVHPASDGDQEELELGCHRTRNHSKSNATQF